MSRSAPFFFLGMWGSYAMQAVVNLGTYCCLISDRVGSTCQTEATRIGRQAEG